MAGLSQSKLAGMTAETMLTDSTRFESVHYLPEKDGITICAGESGNIALKWDRLDGLMDDLYEFREVYDEAYRSRRTG
jgi:hypothetical protein